MATFLVVGVIALWTAYCLIRLRSKKHRGCAACASYQAGSCQAKQALCDYRKDHLHSNQ
ncbi:FeoB-associated Cys-rich membrane protein [Holdemania massiliensis]|uniref:FeoB-associated Cys-rich membrane protein n=1 Tax=Holdemania massiliensis TaxID=1468449 RepID=A0A6N7SAC9_9FIRM|nr:FeoB-associated Cys-rich membrane protein [Holdemania massiliensis]MSA72567.1 hypothetical protein [Holdemania massiliensis]MSA90843.1 hypothetical protein [Holdemania massiliensis]MSB79653.1 hypothetical protein [Holdemania massiliensis]MSC34574.1 hypothetical protein [Holdemania massiliensis]MSC40963.1 hypothetical protein [Holdemania massiliensis]